MIDSSKLFRDAILHSYAQKLLILRYELEDISFNAGGDEMPNVYLNISEDYVVEHLGKDEAAFDTRRYIL